MSENFQHWLHEQMKPHTILLIDDSKDDCESIQNKTKKFNVTWVVAYDLADAKHCLKCQLSPKISMVILDLKLASHQHGIEAFRWLREHLTGVPIVILSGHMTTDAIQAITRIGFAVFCEKPACWESTFFSEMFAVLNIPLRPISP